MSIKPVASIISGIALIVIATVGSGCGKSTGGELPPKRYATCNMLLNLAASGCDGYKSSKGAYPDSLDQLNAYRDDIPHKDAWGHDFGFTAFDAAKGYGEVISYGQDGKPGGTGDDSDLVIRFPVKANADWDRQQIMGIKVPANMQGNTNWFEFYLR